MQDRGDNQASKPAPKPQPSPPPAGPGTILGAPHGETLQASLARSGIALRPATPADAEFCYHLHKAAMGEYVAAIWGWDEQAQRAFHQRAFNPDRWQIITAGQAGIGRPGHRYPDHQRAAGRG
jgi:hypothetical protein